MKLSRLLLLAPAATALLLAGCNILPEPQPDSARFYVLESNGSAVAPEAQAVRVGLRRVEVPSYLRGKTMVVRNGANELRYIDSARWAEPLDQGLMRVLRDQLSGRVAVSTYPFPVQVERDFDVTLHITAAEGREDGVRFTATFEVVRVKDNGVVARRSYTAPAAAWGGDYGRLAAELSRAAAGLADEIVAAVAAK